MATIPALAASAVGHSSGSLGLASHAAALAVPQAAGAMTLVVVIAAIAALVALVRAARLTLSLISQFLQVAARVASTLFTLAIFVVVSMALLVHLR